MNDYRCYRRTQENGVLISGMPTAAERRKPDWRSLERFRRRNRVRYCHSPSLLLAIPTDLRRQLDKKFLHSAVTLIDGLIGVCRKTEFSLQEVDVRPASSHPGGEGHPRSPRGRGRRSPVRRKRHQRATRRPDLRSGSLSVRGLFSSAMRLQPVFLRDIGGI
jgi:hypothetical protein